MGIPRAHPLDKLANSIEAAQSNELTGILERLLRGIDRPPLADPDKSPWQIVCQVIELVSPEKNLAQRTAVCLSTLLWNTVDLLEEAKGKSVSIELIGYLKEQLSLAGFLPREQKLWEILIELNNKFRDLIEAKLAEKAAENLKGLLWKALVYHQIDRTLHERWKEILKNPRENKSWIADWWIYMAWHGILWLPPDQGEEFVDYVPIKEVCNALLILDGSLKDHPRKQVLLRRIVGDMDYAFPAPPKWWHEKLDPLMHEGTESLIKILDKRWPGISPEYCEKFPRFRPILEYISYDTEVGSPRKVSLVHLWVKLRGMDSSPELTSNSSTVDSSLKDYYSQLQNFSGEEVRHVAYH